MSRLGNILSEIANRLTGSYIVKNYSASITCGGNNYGYATANALQMSTPTGYSPIGIASFSSDSTCPVTNVSAKATGTQGAVWVRNVTSSTQTPAITLSVLYAKTKLGGGLKSLILNAFHLHRLEVAA